MPSRWAPSRRVVSKTWNASPSGELRGAAVPGCAANGAAEIETGEDETGEDETGNDTVDTDQLEASAANRSPIWEVLATEPLCRVARSNATAASTRRAASGRPRWSSSSATDSTVAVGSAIPVPAMSGAEPCTGSN